MGAFTILDTTGLFYLEAGRLRVESETGPALDVQAALAPLLGQRVKLLLTYVPDESRQAAGHGCCYWGEAQWCPVHRTDPQRLLRFFREGVLTEEGAAWRIDQEPIPLLELNGHRGRLLGVTVLGAEELRQLGPEALLGEQMQMMQAALAYLQRR